MCTYFANRQTGKQMDYINALAVVSGTFIMPQRELTSTASVSWLTVVCLFF